MSYNRDTNLIIVSAKRNEENARWKTSQWNWNASSPIWQQQPRCHQVLRIWVVLNDRRYRGLELFHSRRAWDVPGRTHGVACNILATVILEREAGSVSGAGRSAGSCSFPGFALLVRNLQGGGRGRNSVWLLVGLLITDNSKLLIFADTEISFAWACAKVPY